MKQFVWAFGCCFCLLCGLCPLADAAGEGASDSKTVLARVYSEMEALAKEDANSKIKSFMEAFKKNKGRAPNTEEMRLLKGYAYMGTYQHVIDAMVCAENSVKAIEGSTVMHR